MSTKNVSKCSYYGKVLLDLTGDTVTESTLKKGATAHDATGTKIIGTLTIPESQTKTMDLNMVSGDQVVKPDSGKVLSQVTVKKPSTFTAENIKKDVNIGGVVGTYAGSGSGGGQQIQSTPITIGNNTLFPLPSDFFDNYFIQVMYYDKEGVLRYIDFDETIISESKIVDVLGDSNNGALMVVYTDCQYLAYGQTDGAADIPMIPLYDENQGMYIGVIVVFTGLFFRYSEG